MKTIALYSPTHYTAASSVLNCTYLSQNLLRSSLINIEQEEAIFPLISPFTAQIAKSNTHGKIRIITSTCYKQVRFNYLVPLCF